MGIGSGVGSRDNNGVDAKVEGSVCSALGSCVRLGIGIRVGRLVFGEVLGCDNSSSGMKIVGTKLNRDKALGRGDGIALGRGVGVAVGTALGSNVE